MVSGRIRWDLFQIRSPLRLDASSTVLELLLRLVMLQTLQNLESGYDPPVSSGSAPVILASSELLLASPSLSSNFSKRPILMPTRSAA